MTEPRKTPRTDAAERKWRKGPGEDGWQTSRAIEIETQELAEAAQKLLNELDGEAFHQVGPPSAELLYEHAGEMRAALARHRAKQSKEASK